MLKRHLVVVACVLTASRVWGAPPAPPKAGPTTAAAPKADAGRALKAVVVSVSGPAQKLMVAKGQKKWQPLKAGDQLDELTIIRTGLGAKVVLRIEDRGEFVINNATKGGIGELRKKGTEVKAEFGLKYGTMRASVESGRGKNDFQITTPVATLSIRGSIADVGFMVDSPRMLDAKAGLWRVLRTQSLAQVREDLAERVFQAGEMGNTSDETPIAIALQERAVQIYDSFGITYSEQKTLTENQTGSRAGNTPSGGSTTTTVIPITIQPATVPTPPPAPPSPPQKRVWPGPFRP